MTPENRPSRIWEFAGCEFDEAYRELRVKKTRVELEAKPLQVLYQLLLHAGEVVSHDEFFAAVWPGQIKSDSLLRSLFAAISRLRKVLPDLDPPVILTIHGFGYRLTSPITVELIEPGPRNALKLKVGDEIPGRPNWIIEEQLVGSHASEIWLARRVKTREMRVFKFALTAGQLDGLKREVTLSRWFMKALPSATTFIQVVDWNFDREPFFLESAYGGLSLDAWVKRDGGLKELPLESRLGIFVQVASAVAAAHSVGVLHKDLKPGNILVEQVTTAASQQPHIRIADFGSAVLSDPERLREFDITNLGFDSPAPNRAAAGTWTYTAPEVREGGVATAAADIYSLGVLLYQMVIADFSRQLTVGWESEVSDPLLREDIACAASGDPAKRLTSAAELASRLSQLEERREQIRDADAALYRAASLERKLTQTRARRPWIAAAIVFLLAGICTSLGFYRRAARDRDIADARNADLASMNDFLAKDLIGQSNPLQRSTGTGSVQQETLLEAVKQAIPQIDRRFSKAPAVAGQLHEAIAGALDARTEFAAAEEQFDIAAQRFRAAEGPLSQHAIIARLRRENTLARTQMPTSIAQAKADLKTQKQLMTRLPEITPELQAWAALAETAAMIFGSRPEEGVQLLNSAIRRAEKTPGFSPSLLIALKVRFCGIYLRLNDGQKAERAARDVITTISAFEGPESTALFEPKMALAEALYLQGKFQPAIEQSGKDYARFSQVLGPDNQLTVAALYMRAAAEGSIEDYDDAIRDELAIYSAEHSNPSGKFIQEDSLDIAASFECHAGRIAAGIDHARQVIRESGPSATAQPAFVNTGKFTIAECLISQEENSGRKRRAEDMEEADSLLKTVDVPLVSSMSGLADFEGSVALLEARIALLQGNRELARKYVEKATPFLDKPGGDAYQLKVLARVKSFLSK